MTADERLTLICAKVKRAKQYIGDLDIALKALKNSNVYSGKSQPHPQTGYNIFKVGEILDPLQIPELRDTILPITGDILHNLRSALDYLAWQLSDMTGLRDTLAESKRKQISFPIIDTRDPKKYESERIGKVRAMRQDAVDKIDGLEPYEGGKGHDLWILHKLDNIDKHRLLVTAVADLQSIRFNYKRSDGTPGPYAEIVKFSIDMDEPLRPALKTDEELFIHRPHSDEDIKLVMEIAFRESGIIEGKAILPTLQQLADLVDRIILSFRDNLS